MSLAVTRPKKFGMSQQREQARVEQRERLKKRESKLYTKAVYNIYKERERERVK